MTGNSNDSHSRCSTGLLSPKHLWLKGPTKAVVLCNVPYLQHSIFYLQPYLSDIFHASPKRMLAVGQPLVRSITDLQIECGHNVFISELLSSSCSSSPPYLGKWLPQTSRSNRGWQLWPPPRRHRLPLTMPRQSRQVLIEDGLSSTQLGSSAVVGTDRCLEESRRGILRMISCRRLWAG